MDWYNDKFMLLEHLKRKGLYFSGNESLSELQQIANNLLGEFKKRGTPLVISEIKRLLNYKSTDEFFFELLDNGNVGWYLDANAPFYCGLENIKSLNKMLEKNGVENLSNYYLLNGAYGVEVVSDFDNENNEINVIRIFEDNAGIYPSPIIPLDKRNITVNPLLDYEFSFKIKQTVSFANLKFGVFCYDINYNIIHSIAANYGQNLNYFVSIDNLYPQNEYVKIKAILYNCNRQLTLDDTAYPNILNSDCVNLIMPSNTAYVYPFIYRTLGDINIYDIRVALLNSNPFVGFIENSNYILNKLKNNSSYYNDIEVEEIINTYLVPVNTNFKLNE